MIRSNVFIGDELFAAYVYGEWFLSDCPDGVHDAIEEFERVNMLIPNRYRIMPITELEEHREIQVGVE